MELGGPSPTDDVKKDSNCLDAWALVLALCLCFSSSSSRSLMTDCDLRGALSLQWHERRGLCSKWLQAVGLLKQKGETGLIGKDRADGAGNSATKL